SAPERFSLPSTHLSPLIANDWFLEGRSHGKAKRKGITAIFAARGLHRPACLCYRRWRRRCAGAATLHLGGVGPKDGVCGKGIGDWGRVCSDGLKEDTCVLQGLDRA